MTYIEIEKFYYPSSYNTGDDAPFYLRVKGKSGYRVVGADPQLSPSDPATGTITISIEVNPNNVSQTYNLGTHEVGASKNLDIIVKEGDTEKERGSTNFDEAEPE